MKVEYLKKFSKDLDSLNIKSMKRPLIRLIEFMEDADTLEEIPNINKLKGHKTDYRVRLGALRILF